MSQNEIKLYYKNVKSQIIGDRDGITEKQFQELEKLTTPAIKRVNEERQAGKTPYRELPYKQENLKEVNRLTALLNDKCENLVILGIGGSALGAIALQTALKPYTHNLDESRRIGPRLFVFDNVDPAQFAEFLEYISDKLDKTIFNVVSKSGRTAETASQFLIVRELLLNKFGPKGLRKHLVATTDSEKGTLRNIVEDEGLLSLQVPEGVGGRFSVLSAVGLFMAAMEQMDTEALLAGARDMDARVSSENFCENPAAINAAINYHYYNRGKKISVMMPYAYGLKDLADWYRQLWAESLGKKTDLADTEVHIGPTPVKALGTTDQHSQVQLYREGPNDKLFTFLHVNHFEKDLKIAHAPKIAPELAYLADSKMSKLLNSEKAATEYALLKDKRPCITVYFDRLDAYSTGQFIYLYEVTTSLAADLFNINAYDQPAVELAKEATFALMGRQGYEMSGPQIQTITNIDEKFLV